MLHKFTSLKVVDFCSAWNFISCTEIDYNNQFFSVNSFLWLYSLISNLWWKGMICDGKTVSLKWQFLKKKDLIQVLSVNNSDCLQKEKTEKSKRTRSRSEDPWRPKPGRSYAKRSWSPRRSPGKREERSKYQRSKLKSRGKYMWPCLALLGQIR